MSKKSGSGKDGGGDDVLTLTPTADFDIRKEAQRLSELMITFERPLVLRLPHVSIEFEPGCTRKEIIDGYTLAIRGAVPANGNAKKGKP
jgi:hypothetical protein